MEWNYKELSATLRAEMSSSHPPIVVIKDDKKGKTEMSNLFWKDPYLYQTIKEVRTDLSESEIEKCFMKLTSQHTWRIEDIENFNRKEIL